MTESPAHGPHAIEVDAVTLSYGLHVAVDNLTFRAEPGMVVALLGPNGAGKSSTVEMLEGYRRPNGGRVRVLGCDPIRDAVMLRPRIGIMLQSGGIYNGAKTGEVVRLFAAFYSHPQNPDELLDLVGLTDRARTTCRHLSGGERRRLALAVALVGNPEIVFLDEPTAGMDPKARIVTYEIIRDLRERGATVLLTTHLLDEAEDLADWVVIVDRGRLVAEGTPAELMATRGIQFGTDAKIARDAWPECLGALEPLRPGHYLVYADATPERLAAITAWAAEQGILLRYLSAGARCLEDVFLELVQ